MTIKNMAIVPDYLLTEAFCQNGDYIDIPENGTNDSIIVNAKYGFTIPYQQDPDLGGKLVPRAAMNGVLRKYTLPIVFLNLGGQFTFNNLIIEKGGYKKDAVLFCNSQNYKGFVYSKIEDNIYNFNENQEYLGIYWGLINSYFPDIQDDGNGNIIFNGNTTTTGTATFNNLNAQKATFANQERTRITSVSGDNRVAVLGDLKTTSDTSLITDSGFGGACIDTGYNSDSFPGIKDGGSIGKTCVLNAVYTAAGNAAMCQVIVNIGSFIAYNGYNTLSGRSYTIPNARDIMTSFGLTFGDFYPLPKTFVSSNNCSAFYNGNDIILSVSGGNIGDNIPPIYNQSFVALVVGSEEAAPAPQSILYTNNENYNMNNKVNLSHKTIGYENQVKQHYYNVLKSELQADQLILNKNDSNKINFYKNNNVYQFDANTKEITFINSVKNESQLKTIEFIENGTIKTHKKMSKTLIKEIKKRLKNNEDIDIYNDYINKLK